MLDRQTVHNIAPMFELLLNCAVLQQHKLLPIRLIEKDRLLGVAADSEAVEPPVNFLPKLTLHVKLSHCIILVTHSTETG